MTWNQGFCPRFGHSIISLLRFSTKLCGIVRWTWNTCFISNIWIKKRTIQQLKLAKTATQAKPTQLPPQAALSPANPSPSTHVRNTNPENKPPWSSKLFSKHTPLAMASRPCGLPPVVRSLIAGRPCGLPTDLKIPYRRSSIRSASCCEDPWSKSLY